MTTGLDNHARYGLPIWAVRAARIIVNESTKVGYLHAARVRETAQLIVLCQADSTLECTPWTGVPIEGTPS